MISLLFKQDFVVREVRRVLFETISSFPGSLEKEKDLSRLIETQFKALREAFRVASESGEDVENKVAAKLLNLYRTGRLGHYTLDSVPRNIQWLVGMKMLHFYLFYVEYFNH